MKIVCQNCSAKYSIADDKVQGKKVFKFKCKKCGADIVARGSETGASGEADLSASHVAQDPFGEDEATRIGGPPGAAAAAMAAAMAGGAGSDGEWHAVVNGDQKGPYTVAQLQEMLASKTITPETFVWRDGFGDWKPMKEVGELSSLTSRRSGGADLFGGASGGGDALFEGDGKGKGAGGSGEAKARPGSKASSGSDLFGDSGGGSESSSSSSSSSSSASASSATGARNENSVLFSLSSLQQVAGAGSDDKKTKDADKSGLIDLKSGSSGGSKKAVDDILTIAPSSGLGGGPLVNLAPVATPVSDEPQKQQGGSKTTLIALVAVALILAGGAVAAVMIFKKDTPAPAPAAAPAQPPQPTVDPEALKRELLEAMKAQNAAGQTGANAMTPEDIPLMLDMVTALNAGKAPPAKPASMDQSHYDMLLAQATTRAKPTTVASADPTPNTGSSNGRPSSDSRPHSSSSSSSSSSASARPSSDSRPSTPSSSSSSSSSASSSAGTCASRCNGNVACLLGCTGGGNSRPSTPTAPTQPRTNPTPATTTTPAPSGGSETPGRNDIVSAMNAVRASVMRCAAGQAGTAMVAVTFSGASGRVTSANVSGAPFAGSPAGGCIATAVRAAHVPPFTRPTFSVNYPFAIH